MTSGEIVEKVKTALNESVREAEVNLGDPVLFVESASLHNVVQFLKEDPDLNFDYLSNITGADYLNEDREPRFEVVYELHSIDKNHSIRIRVGLNEDE